MLPLLTLPINDITETGFNPLTGGLSSIGDAYWFSRDKVLSSATEAGMNLDKFLTFRLSGFLAKKRPKSIITIFYTPFDGRFVLTVCSNKQVSFMDALHMSSGMPGYLEYGRDFVPPSGKLFFYYAGLQAYRLYEVEDPAIDAFYISDFGNLFGLITAPEEEKKYKDILMNPTDYVEYTAVPTEPTTYFAYKDEKISIQHAFVNRT